MCSKKVQVQLTDDHGRGVFAREAFEVGDELIRESPIIKVPNATRAIGFRRRADTPPLGAAGARERCRRLELIGTLANLASVPFLLL